MPPTHQGLRGHDETGDIGHVFGRDRDERGQSVIDNALFQTSDDFLIHDGGAMFKT
jgi:hypothetical protein